MKKVILIEDRVERQKNYLKAGYVLNDHSDFKMICGGNEYTILKNDIVNKKFEKLNEFNVIAIHRSALSSEDRANLIDFCKANGKDLVFFSGGISSVLIQNIDKNYLLTINSKDFYSENLHEFLKNNEKNLMILAFGRNWELNLMFRLAEKLSNYNSDETFEFQEISDITSWEKKMFFDGYSDDRMLNKEDIIKKINEINKKIDEFYESTSDTQK